ncbi:efflux RND transporter permease subunit [Membranihabitans maritimus]|uniref:efflux RND transporter permease subunit n=1 Tax=Membranihabitans maritimus TaxID=2904244 RepID=UPI001F010491|nr:efflux RND transporter permease subunit [Membranihabitans maritimus]
MLNQFINRPVLSTVISIIILILGFLGLTTLPVTQYPDIAPPTVRVTANYAGANAQTVLESVIIPIEEQINGVEGMTYMTSSAGNDGSATIEVFFEQDINPDIAAVNVQNRVSRANALLPREVVQSGVITQKQQNSSLMYASMYSTNPDYDEKFIENYLNINVIPELQRINGVGEVRAFGGKTYAMRIWIKPDRLAVYNLTPDDVIQSLNEQSLEAAAGSLGVNSGEAFEYVLRYPGRYKEADEYGDIIIKSLDNGQLLRLKDVADVELDAQSYSAKAIANNYPGVNFGVFQTPGSNAQEIIEKVEARLEELQADFPPGVEYLINFNVNDFLTASIDKVVHTLVEAFLLVFFVVFIFLQDFRSTLIPAIAVPVSIIGTFFFLNMFGFSINLLTLFALLLAIGIVVDDAIVVVEAVHAKLEDGVHDAKEATKTAMSEIAGAIVSITLVMSAVFVPVTFMQGSAGVFYKQFGVTLIIAILISAVNALTLSPALCAIFLKKHADKKKNGNRSFFQRFYDAFNAGFNAMRDKYVGSLSFLLKYKWITAVILLAAVGGTLWFNNNTPSGFIPSEDRGVIFINIELPEGSSFDRSYEVIEELNDSINGLESLKGKTLIAGRNFFSGGGGSYAMGFILLKDWEERGKNASVNAIIEQLNQKSTAISDANIIFFTPPSVRGFGRADGFDVEVLDRTGGSFKNLDETATNFVQQLMQNPEIAFASNSFSTNFPQYQIDLNVAKAKEAGVSVSSILSTLQGYIGGFYAADFSRFGKQYRVFVQAPPEDRSTVADLDRMMVKNDQGQMSPISEFVNLDRVYGPQTVNRFNLFNSVAITGQATPGFSSGDAIRVIQETADRVLPQGFDFAFAGITREEIASAGQSTIIFGLSIVFVFFFLAAQYESYLLPLSVMLSLPVGVMGAYFSTWAMGLENNIYFQIALIMLIGLLAKNAILIVEFARQRRLQGFSLYEAATQGARARLRPILMTSFAFILGLTPLVFANGVGAVGNRSIGTGAAGGLLIGTILGVFVIPILFVAFQWLQERVSGVPEAVESNVPDSLNREN